MQTARNVIGPLGRIEFSSFSELSGLLKRVVTGIFLLQSLLQSGEGE